MSKFLWDFKGCFLYPFFFCVVLKYSFYLAAWMYFI